MLFQIDAAPCYVAPSLLAESSSLDLLHLALRKAHRTCYSGTWVLLNRWENAVLFWQHSTAIKASV